MDFLPVSFPFIFVSVTLIHRQHLIMNSPRTLQGSQRFYIPIFFLYFVIVTYYPIFWWKCRKILYHPIFLKDGYQLFSSSILSEIGPNSEVQVSTPVTSDLPTSSASVFRATAVTASRKVVIFGSQELATFELHFMFVLWLSYISL